MSRLPDWISAQTSALDSKMGLELTEVTAQRCAGRMPVAGNTQPFGYWHGGASCVLAETLASIAGFVAVGPGGSAFGIDINATHHRPVRDGWVTGVATVLHLGGRIGNYEVAITDDSGERISTARVTVYLQRPRSASRSG